MNYYIGDVYTIAPSAIRFDQSWIEYNRRYTDTEYSAIKASIADTVQLDPISINSITGLCEDGRTRVQICTELGIDVKCQLIEGSLDVSIRREIYMRNQMGRELTTAQKAIMAYKFMLLTSCSQDRAVLKHKSNKMEIAAVIQIAGLKRQDVLDELMSTGEWGGSKSLRTIASNLKKDTQEVVVTPSTTPVIEYEDMINTEVGKTEFWRLDNLTALSHHERRMMIIELLNRTYKLIVDPQTGEVTESNPMKLQGVTNE